MLIVEPLDVLNLIYCITTGAAIFLFSPWPCQLDFLTPEFKIYIFIIFIIAFAWHRV